MMETTSASFEDQKYRSVFERRDNRPVWPQGQSIIRYPQITQITQMSLPLRNLRNLWIAFTVDLMPAKDPQSNPERPRSRR
jgi:hypothetical protein